MRVFDDFHSEISTTALNVASQLSDFFFSPVLTSERPRRPPRSCRKASGSVRQHMVKSQLPQFSPKIVKNADFASYGSDFDETFSPRSCRGEDHDLVSMSSLRGIFCGIGGGTSDHE